MSGESGTVLLVDDHEDGRELLREFLSMTGVASEGCASAEEALAWVDARGLPKVVVTDLTLGAMSGLELARALRARSASLPIFAVTGHAGFSDTDGVFTGVFVKPVAITELAEKIRALL